MTQSNIVFLLYVGFVGVLLAAAFVHKAWRAAKEKRRAPKLNFPPHKQVSPSQREEQHLAATR